MTETTDDARLPIAARINKLLAKAVSTDNTHEAEAYTAKAQELMEANSITDELLRLAQGEPQRDELIQQAFTYTGIQAPSRVQITHIIALLNDCRTVQTGPMWVSVNGEKPKRGIKLGVFGFKSDLDRITVLESSVQLQAVTALNLWWRQENRLWMSGSDAFKAKREFLYAYSTGLAERLRRAKREGQRAAANQEADRIVNNQSVGQDQAVKSVELVLRSKKLRVDDYVDGIYGNSLRKIKTNYSSGGVSARNAGYAAGRSADLGHGRVGNGPKGISS